MTTKLTFFYPFSFSDDFRMMDLLDPWIDSNFSTFKVIFKFFFLLKFKINFLTKFQIQKKKNFYSFELFNIFGLFVCVFFVNNQNYFFFDNNQDFLLCFNFLP